MNEVHGHEVLHMMINSGKAYTRESLVAKIQETFGAETRFRACSTGNLTAAELVEFLDQKGKLLRHADGLRTSVDVMCQH